MKTSTYLLIASLASLAAAFAMPTWAQEAVSGMHMHSTHQKAPPAKHHHHAGKKSGMDMQTQEAEALPNTRSADYSDGFGYTSMPGMHEMGGMALGKLMFDHLEYTDGREGHAAALDAQAWYGTDADKVWVKLEGEHAAGRMQHLRVEVLWDRPIAVYWDGQLGVRQDAGVGPGRTWAAFGVQGLAPYWFDVEATLYIGQAGRTAFRFESEYELLLTQRLILEPDLEVNVYGRDDPQRHIGAGLSDAALGLRLRYEFTRQFAPYVGIQWSKKFGNTADYARRAGQPVFDSRLVAGVRLWF